MTSVIVCLVACQCLAQSGTATLTIDIDPTIGIGNQGRPDLTQWNALLYDLGDGLYGYRMFYDPEGDAIANPEFVEVRDTIPIVEVGDYVRGGYAAIPWGDFSWSRYTPPTNIKGTPASGIQNLVEYLFWKKHTGMNDWVFVRCLDSPAVFFESVFDWGPGRELTVQLVEEWNSLYSDPLVELEWLEGQAGDRPAHFDYSKDWEIKWTDLPGQSGQYDLETRWIWYDLFSASYNTRIQESSDALMEGSFSLYSDQENLGYIHEVDKQVVRLFNYSDIQWEYTWGYDPELFRGAFQASKLFLPEYQAESGEFMDGAWSQSQLIASTTLDSVGTGSFIEFPIAGVSSVPYPQTNSRLSQNHPNPFNPSTTIPFTLPSDSYVSLRIYSVDGKLVRTLLDGQMIGEGLNHLAWDGRSEDGQSVSAGVYFYRLETGGFSETKRMALVK